MRDRRSFVKGIGALGTIAVAGCSGDGGDGSSSGDGSDGSSSTDTATSTPTGPDVTFGGDEELNFNLSPSVPQSDLYVQYGRLRDYLERYVTDNFDVPAGLDARMNVGTNYSAVIQALGQGTADIAETGPFAAVVGNETGNAEVIVQRFGYGSWTYKSIIATPNDSSISSVEELEGKKIAFSDPLSTSGFLFPAAAIKEAGVDIGNLPEGNGSQAAFTPNFAGGHVQSYTLLKEGQVDAAAMGGFVRDTPAGPSTEAFQSNATTLHEDTGLPRAPIVVSSQLDDEAKSALQEAFLEAPAKVYDGADGKDGTDDDLWFSKVRKSTIDDYSLVADKAETLGIGADFFSG